MSRRSVLPVLILLAVARPAAAQDSAAADPSAASTAAAEPAPKKKGMFGKLKAIAGNKTVQTIAKVAACTMVPGGQFVAAGIDAASNPNAGGIATAVAGGATGAACGMGGMGGGAMAAGPGLASMGGVNASTVATVTTATAALFTSPGGGGQPDATGTLSAKDEKKMRATLKKQGMTQDQIDATVASYRQQNQPQPPAPSDGSRFGGQQNLPQTVAVAGAGAQPVGLPDDYDAQLKAGKLVLADLPWKGATAGLIPGTEDGVRITFVKIVESLSYTQGTWHVDVYVSENDKGVAQSRATAIVVLLTNAGLPAEEKLGGTATTAAKSKQARVELVRN
jgi:hypothetical protein